MLTTFFTAELIGEKYGFLTANRWGASEHDDLRHWGRFEQFRRAETRASLIRPELFLREPVGVMSPWRSGGGVGAASPQTSHVQGMPGLQGTGPTRAREECWADVKGKDRDFVFMRIKEHFLVPDHRVKDISGASFAGESSICRVPVSCASAGIDLSAKGRAAVDHEAWAWGTSRIADGL